MRLSLLLPILLPLVSGSGLTQKTITPAALHAEATVFHGPPGGFGAIARYRIADGLALPPDSRLAGVRMASVDAMGRAQWHLGNPTRTQAMRDLPGGHFRVVLPNGRGTLYQYHRAPSSGPEVYGYLLVPPHQRARTLIERPVVTGSVSPFLPLVSVSPSGDAFLTATTMAAGGDLIETYLDGRPPVIRTQTLDPLLFGERSFGLGAQFGYGVHSNGVVHFARTAGRQAQPLTIPPPLPSMWSTESALSEAGTAAILFGGSSSAQLRPYSLTQRGTLSSVPVPESNILPTGHLPQVTGGPFLSISDNGQHLAWVVDVGVTRELMSANLSSPLPPETVTADNHIINTLEEVGRIRHFASALVFAVGETNDPTEGGLEAADVFVAQVADTGTFSMINVTGTMGDSSLPFFTGVPTLAPQEMRLLPGGDIFIFDAESEALLLYDRSTGTLNTLTSDVKDLFWAKLEGDWIACAIERRSGSKPVQVLRVSLANLGVAFTADPGSPSHLFDQPIALEDQWIGFRSIIGAQQSMQRLHLPTGQYLTWTGAGTRFDPPFLATQGGGFGFTESVGQVSRQWLWPTPGSQSVELQHPSFPGHLLP